MGSSSNKLVGWIMDPIGLISGGKLHGLSPIRYEKDTSQVDAAAIAAKEAAEIEQAAAEAEALAEETAKEEARKKLSQQTKTIFTSGLGLLGSDTQTKKTTLGS